MCSRCFQIILNGNELEDYELHERHDSNVCIWCRNSLHGRSAHSVPEGPEMQLIAEAISPRVVSTYLVDIYKATLKQQTLLELARAGSLYIQYLT